MQGVHTPPGRELNKFGEGLNLGEAVCTCDVLCISVAYKISKRSTRVMTKMVITVIRQQQAKRRRDKGSHRHLSWAPAGMGKRGHLIPLENVVKCFCAIVVTAKHSVDELFMYYFYICRRLLWTSPRDPPARLHSWTPLGDFPPQTLNLPTPGKNPVSHFHL